MAEVEEDGTPTAGVVASIDKAFDDSGDSTVDDNGEVFDALIAILLKPFADLSVEYGFETKEEGEITFFLVLD